SRTCGTRMRSLILVVSLAKEPMVLPSCSGLKCVRAVWGRPKRTRDGRKCRLPPVPRGIGSLQLRAPRGRPGSGLENPWAGPGGPAWGEKPALLLRQYLVVAGHLIVSHEPPQGLARGKRRRSRPPRRLCRGGADSRCRLGHRGPPRPACRAPCRSRRGGSWLPPFPDCRRFRFGYRRLAIRLRSGRGAARVRAG